jgi:translocation and assembly module TamB
MQGDVLVQKRRGGELILSGTINTVRGTFVVAGRELDLARGHIMFTGGHDINPELDIVAQYRVQNYVISATVGGSANEPTLNAQQHPRSAPGRHSFNPPIN